MIKTQIRSRQVFDLPRMLEDLNGRRQPYGLALYFRDTLGNIAAGMDFTRWTDDYQRLLRSYVDLWLATGRKNAVETPAARRPVPAVSDIVARAMNRDRVAVAPTLLKDGYSMMIVAVQERASGRPRGGRKAREAAQDAAIVERSAERCFVHMLMSDWRLKIAKCSVRSCGIYFRLGKWDHRYTKGTRCPNCQQIQQQGAIQKRVEANRLQIRQALYALAGARFARHIVPGSPWYEDAELKRKIADALNQHFREDPLFRTFYPKGITGKWVEAGHKRNKNWLFIERAKQAAA